MLVVKQMIEMHPLLGMNVTGNRADEMVLAGAAPTASSVGDPIAHVHRGTSFILLVDGAIVVFIFAQIFMSLGLLSGPLGAGVIGGVTFAGLMVYGGYRNRKSWAYWPAVSVLVLASIIFAFNALVSLYMLVMGGYLSNILFVVLFSWAAMGSGRRALFHWHQATGPGTTTPISRVPSISRKVKCLLRVQVVWPCLPFALPCWERPTVALTVETAW